jgi:HSP20 family protein
LSFEHHVTELLHYAEKYRHLFCSDCRIIGTHAIISEGVVTMNITPRYGRNELETMRERLDRVLSEFGGRTWELLDRSMPIDVHENETEITVKASVPGVSSEDLDIQYSDGMLTIRAKSEESSEDETGTWHVKEMRSGMAERSIALPRGADIENAEASLENGVLRIRFPITEESKRRRIPIR